MLPSSKDQRIANLENQVKVLRQTLDNTNLQLSRALAATAYCLDKNYDHANEIDDRDRTIKRQERKALAHELEMMKLNAGHARVRRHLDMHRDILKAVNMDREDMGLRQFLTAEDTE